MTQPVDAGLNPPLSPADARPRAGADLALVTAPDVATTASSSKPAPPPTSPKEAAASIASSTRLLVEAGKGAEGFVYKLVSRTTGQILSEFPREAAKALAQSTAYQSGAVLDESA